MADNRGKYLTTVRTPMDGRSRGARRFEEIYNEVFFESRGRALEARANPDDFLRRVRTCPALRIPDGYDLLRRRRTEQEVAAIAKNLLRWQPKLQTLAVCSRRDEGRTTTVLNLARYLARNIALRVLLVDANNVHPVLHTFFPEGFDRGPGLTSLEEGAAILDRIVFSERDNLFILPSSGDLPAGARSDDTVGRFLTILRNLFDIVLFDVPSFERGGKTMLSFLGKLDVAVILARATITDLEEVLAERDKLRHAGALSVATILVQR